VKDNKRDFIQASSFSTKKLYDEVYKIDGHDYGRAKLNDVSTIKYDVVKKYLDQFHIDGNKIVLEIGCGIGRLHDCHPNWMGIEYSGTAVALAKQRFGQGLNIKEGDARSLPVESCSVDFLYSIATLEHVPAIELAFQEIERVLKPGGIAVLAPAWNARPWTVKKLQQRPYGELTPLERVGKFLIPVRENILFRMLCSFPARLSREVRISFGRIIPLEYKELKPDFSLWDTYPHIADDDAFVSIDAHSALCYFVARKWGIISHPNRIQRSLCRHGEIVLQKPNEDGAFEC